MKEQKIAVIGFGMWGKNIVRNFYNLNVLDIVCDLDEEVHKRTVGEITQIQNILNVDGLARSLSDAFAIVTKHFNYARANNTMPHNSDIYHNSQLLFLW